MSTRLLYYKISTVFVLLAMLKVCMCGCMKEQSSKPLPEEVAPEEVPETLGLGIYLNSPGEQFVFDNTYFVATHAVNKQLEVKTIAKDNVIVYYNSGYLAYCKGDEIVQIKSLISDNVLDIEFLDSNGRYPSIVIESALKDEHTLTSLVSIEHNKLVWSFLNLPGLVDDLPDIKSESPVFFREVENLLNQPHGKKNQQTILLSRGQTPRKDSDCLKECQ